MSLSKQITLREAAKLSGYTSDYVGSLIRLGKIPGKKLVGTSAWVTTEEAIIEYAAQNIGGRLKSRRKIAIAKYENEINASSYVRHFVSFSFLSEALMVSILILVVVFSGYLFHLYSVVSEKKFEASVASSRFNVTEHKI